MDWDHSLTADCSDPEPEPLVGKKEDEMPEELPTIPYGEGTRAAAEACLSVLPPDDPFAQWLKLYLRDTAALESALRQAETDNREWRDAVQFTRDHYPEDVFPADGKTPDAKAATWVRRLLDDILDDGKRAEMATALAAGREARK